jgi:gliding motility-associated-like protein
MIKKILLALLLLSCITHVAISQCNGQLEPGFTFLTSSRGCAPFTVNIETLFLGAVAGTSYRVNWGDGTALQTLIQANATGVILSHTYPMSPVNCGYDVQIDAFNACNPLGSVVPVLTQVVVWNEDVVNIAPQTFRVCQGFAATINFADNSTWNCFPRATRENNLARWLQWQYGVGVLANQIPNVRVNAILPGAFPYNNPALNTNPAYPFNAPGSLSLPLNIPITLPADVGKDFVVRLRNWNQCNAYDNNIADGIFFNPVSGNILNGDNTPQIGTARIVIVSAPQPNFLTKLNNAAGLFRTFFCVNDNIYFENLTPAITGANFGYTWQFYDNSTGVGVPIATRTNTNPTYAYINPGQKLIRLLVRDNNAFGNCENSFDFVITITPVLQAAITTTDLLNNPITTNFCQTIAPPFTTFNVRFNDTTLGIISPTTEFRWEVYDNNNVFVISYPAVGYSAVRIPFIDRSFVNQGQHRIVLLIRDNATSCQTSATSLIRIFENPIANFNNTTVCENQATRFINASTLNPVLGATINSWEWDLSYDNITFQPDITFTNQTDFTAVLGAAGIYNVALRISTTSSCTALIVKQVTVHPLPIANFTTNTTIACSGIGISFNNLSINNQPDIINTYTWEINRRTGLGFEIDSVQRPTDPGFSSTYIRRFNNSTNAPIFYDIRLRVRTINGCETISTGIALEIYPSPEAGFSSLNYFPFDPNCSPVTINFRVDNFTQSLNPSNYTWSVLTSTNILLNSTSTGTNPNYTYIFTNTTKSIRDYKINLRTSFLSGCSKDSIRTIRINPVPIGTYRTDTVLINCDNIRYRFTANQLGLIRYNWQLYQNNVKIVDSDQLGSFFEYQFSRNSADIIRVELQTTNFANCTSTLFSDIVTVPLRDNFAINFTATPISQFYPNTTVNILNISNPNPGTWNYLWNYGDGVTSILEQPINHTYSKSGTYNITLTISNPYCSVVLTQVVTITPAPSNLNFTFDPPVGCGPLIVNFTAKYLNINPATIVWQIDNKISFGATTTHVFILSGNYNVIITGVDINNVSLKYIETITITVYDTPDLNTAPVSQRICDGAISTVVLTNPNNIPNTLYRWTVTAINVIGHVEELVGAVGPIVNTLSLVNPNIVGTVIYTVTPISNSCIGITKTATVTVNPIPIVNANDITICSDDIVNIKITSNFVTQYQWTLNNVNNVNGAFSSSGTEIVQQLSTDEKGGSVDYVITPVSFGCIGNIDVVKVIVNAKAVARFTVRSFALYTGDPLYVKNLSEGGTSYLWNFGDGFTSTEYEPTHIYTTEGQFDISLTVNNSFNCPDISYLKSLIKIQDGGQILIPNVFTPINGSSTGVSGPSQNDTFLPLISGAVEYEMDIFNRWGELLFVSRNVQVGWDGMYNAKNCPTDTYVYKLIIKFKDGNTVIKTGDVLLLR